MPGTKCNGDALGLLVTLTGNAPPAVLSQMSGARCGQSDVYQKESGFRDLLKSSTFELSCLDNNGERCI